MFQIDNLATEEWEVVTDQLLRREVQKKTVEIRVKKTEKKEESKVRRGAHPTKNKETSQFGDRSSIQSRKHPETQK